MSYFFATVFVMLFFVHGFWLVVVVFFVYVWYVTFIAEAEVVVYIKMALFSGGRK